jgi:hypothetical protein
MNFGRGISIGSAILVLLSIAAAADGLAGEFPDHPSVVESDRSVLNPIFLDVVGDEAWLKSHRMRLELDGCQVAELPVVIRYRQSLQEGCCWGFGYDDYRAKSACLELRPTPNGVIRYRLLPPRDSDWELLGATWFPTENNEYFNCYWIGPSSAAHAANSLTASQQWKRASAASVITLPPSGQPSWQSNEVGPTLGTASCRYMPQARRVPRLRHRLCCIFRRGG